MLFFSQTPIIAVIALALLRTRIYKLYFVPPQFGMFLKLCAIVYY